MSKCVKKKNQYISLSCDYLIWMSPEPKHAWDVHFNRKNIKKKVEKNNIFFVFS
jgi:hypothetical protein